MATTTIRVKTTTHQTLRERAGERGESLSDTVDQLVEEDRRRRMFEAAARSWEKLRQDPEAWAEWQAEVALWDTTIADGLEDESDAEWLGAGRVGARSGRSSSIPSWATSRAASGPPSSSRLMG
jgi:hypothetical protein